MEKLYKKDLIGYEVGYLITLEELGKATGIDKLEAFSFEEDDLEKDYPLGVKQLKINNDIIFNLNLLVAYTLKLSFRQVAFRDAYIEDDFKAVKAYFVIHN